MSTTLCCFSDWPDLCGCSGLVNSSPIYHGLRSTQVRYRRSVTTSSACACTASNAPRSVSSVVLSTRTYSITWYVRLAFWAEDMLTYPSTEWRGWRREGRTPHRTCHRRWRARSHCGLRHHRERDHAHILFLAQQSLSLPTPPSRSRQVLPTWRECARHKAPPEHGIYERRHVSSLIRSHHVRSHSSTLVETKHFASFPSWPTAANALLPLEVDLWAQCTCTAFHPCSFQTIYPFGAASCLREQTRRSMSTRSTATRVTLRLTRRFSGQIAG